MRLSSLLVILILSTLCYSQNIDFKIKTNIRTLKLENHLYTFNDSISISISDLSRAFQNSLDSINDQLKFDTDNDTLLFKSAKYNVVLNRPTIALDKIERCIEIDMNNPEYFWFRGYCKSELNLKELQYFSTYSIMKDFNAALKLDSTYREALNDRGLLYMSMGFTDLGKKDILKVVSLYPKWATANSNMAKIYSSEGNFEKAIDYYKKAIDIESDLPVPFNNLAMVYLKKGEFESALHYFDKAIELDKFYFNAYRNKADLYIRIGKKQLASVELKRAMDLGDEKSDFYYKKECK